jgi:predicted O-methyltransferase YrrM
VKLDWRPVAPGAGPEISTSLTDAEADKLRLLAAGADVLEIGSAYGFSAIVMALAGATVAAVDPHRWLNSHEAMTANLAAYQVSGRVDLRRGPSQTVLPQLAAEGRTFDLVWIDGDHEQAAVARDVALALPLLRPGSGILACHDHGEDTCPGVQAALDAVVGPPHELVDTLAIYRGLA